MNNFAYVGVWLFREVYEVRAVPGIKLSLIATGQIVAATARVADTTVRVCTAIKLWQKLDSYEA